MHSCVTSKNVKWCHLIWPTLYNAAINYAFAVANDINNTTEWHCLKQDSMLSMNQCANCSRGRLWRRIEEGEIRIGCIPSHPQWSLKVAF